VRTRTPLPPAERFVICRECANPFLAELNLTGNGLCPACLDELHPPVRPLLRRAGEGW
jgi:hypothetical protein